MDTDLTLFMQQLFYVHSSVLCQLQTIQYIQPQHHAKLAQTELLAMLINSIHVFTFP